VTLRSDDVTIGFVIGNVTFIVAKRKIAYSVQRTSYEMQNMGHLGDLGA